MAKNKIMTVQDIPISVLFGDTDDYICSYWSWARRHEISKSIAFFCKDNKQQLQNSCLAALVLFERAIPHDMLCIDSFVSSGRFTFNGSIFHIGDSQLLRSLSYFL